MPRVDNIGYQVWVKSSVAEPEPVAPKLFGDLEPESKINLKNIFCSQFWRMLGRRKANF